MSWSTNTARAFSWRRLLACLLGVSAALITEAQTPPLRLPATVSAGTSISLVSQGAGTFYLVGPDCRVKREVRPGQAIAIKSTDLQTAGRYLAILCDATCRSSVFYVLPAEAARLDFLVHPSRAPVGLSDVVSGVALPFDRFHNLLLSEGSVDFRMTADRSVALSRTVALHHGVAWFRASSGRRAGALQVFASLGGLSARRVVQQVAAEPCNLHITARPTPKGMVIETAPVRDCDGNPLPDGTVVTFTRTDGAGLSTVDAPIKSGVARAQMTGHGAAVITAAAGLVMGNQIHIGDLP